MAEKDTLIKKIDQMINEHWSKRETPILLSTLGNAEEGRIAREAREYAGSLANFIEKEVPSARIVKHSEVHSLIGAVPKQIAENADDLLESVQRSSKKARFVDVFWNAFRNPLDADKRRFVLPRSADLSLQIVEITSDEPAPDGSHEIPCNSIDQSVPVNETYSRIISWIEASACEVEDFVKTPVAQQDPGGRDLLRCLLESLSENDAKRMSLPLDIAQKLSRVLL